MTASAASAGRPEREVSGMVKDALGRPLAGAKLTLQTLDGHIIGHATSDKDGHFEFKGIDQGNYELIANHEGFQTAAVAVKATPGGSETITVAMEAEQALSLRVTAERRNVARNGINPAIGGSVYTFDQKAVEQLPQGNNTQMSDLLLQAPGVVQDSFGEIHVRGEHANVQYRINGIQLPEGVTTGFSQSFSPRFAQNVSLLEGALPAQYGYNTAGVVQIQTKSGAALSGGNLEMYGGQRDTLQPSFEYGGAKNNLDYYATGFYLQTARGLEPPTPGPQAIHDFATIGNGFGYLSESFGPSTRVSLLGGFNVSNYQIPANPGQAPAFVLSGVPSYPSANIRETQLEQNYYAVLALQSTLGENADYQIAGFTRYSTLSFHPDQRGDLIYNGVASRVFRGDWTNGLQGDGAYHGLKLLGSHTIRSGFYFTGERAEIDNHALVFPGGISPDSVPFQTSDNPEEIVDNTALTSWLYGVYLQDEWRPFRKLTINYGVRFDLYDGLTRSDQFSPRAGAVYQLTRTTALHAAYARYFTPPPLESVSSADIRKFVGTTNEPQVKQDTTIAPERAHYFDAGVTQLLPHGLKVDLDSYYKKSTDLIDEGQFGPTLIFTPFNYAKGRQYGVEFSASWNWENLTAYTNFAYAVAQGIDIVSDQFLFGADELAYIKNHYVFLDHDQTFTQSGGVAYEWQGFLFTLDNIYQSGLRRGFANTGNLPFYIQFNAGITKSVTLTEIGKLQGRLAVLNLGDWIYQIRNGSGIGVFASQYGIRRSIYGGLKWEMPFFNRKDVVQ
jgi:outer membrane receptor protein involved in Fe transport